MENLKLYLPKVEKCPNISFQMKLLSFLICLVLGFTLTVFAIFQLSYPKAHYRTFSLWYSLNNIIFLISTFILIGPKENYVKLLSEELYTKSVILSGSILLAFLFGLLTTSKIVNLFFDLVQFCSFIVFIFYYIPSIKIKNINTEEEYQSENNINDNNINENNNDINNNYLMN